MITKEELKEKIVSFIKTNNGCKTTELKHYRDSDVTLALTQYNLRSIIDELIENEEVYSIRYILPDGSGKLFLLPIGSDVEYVYRGGPS